ncbi:MAG: hypothetical protein QHI48_08510 [Bacteroidota bacterium]|nr:hypothetical protein [Bacteroidota bacterium]
MTPKHIPSLLLALFLLSAAAIGQETSYKYAPDKPYRYILEFKSDVIQEMAGQSMSVTVEGTASTVLVHDRKTDEGNLHITLTIEDALVLAETPEGTQTFGESLKGKSLGYTIDPTGKMIDNDSLTFKPQQQDMQIIQELLGMFPPLDPEKLSVGGSWERVHTDTLGGSDNPLIRKRKSTYKVTGKENVLNRDCIVIATTRSVETSGKMKRGEMTLRVTGEENGTGTIHFDPAQGIIVRMTLDEKGEQLITDTGGSSLKVNVSSAGKTTLELKPD